MGMHIQLLGVPHFWIRNTEILVESRKAVGLVAYLVSEAKPVSRNHLAFLLWEDGSDTETRHRLSQQIYLLKQALHTPDLIKTQGDLIWIDKAHCTSDLWDFKSLLQQAKVNTPHTNDEVALIGQAVDLYEGEFLSGLEIRATSEFDNWLLFERTELSRLYLSALMTLSDYYDSIGQSSKALYYASRYSKLDPLDESVHRRVMSLLFRAGDRGGALRQYWLCKVILEKELGIEVSQATNETYEWIRKSDPAEGPLFVNGGKSRTLPKAQVIALKTKARRGAKSFVGRAAEIEKLKNYVEEAREGIGNFVIITGETGIGKTALIKELARQCSETDIFNICQCYSSFVNTPFYPVESCVREAIGIGDIKKVNLNQDKWADVNQLLSISGDTLISAHYATQSLLPAKLQMFAGLVDFFCSTSAGEASVLVFEDIEWADELTVEFLEYLCHQVRSKPLLILATVAEEEVNSPNILRVEKQATQTGTLTTLSLARLGKEEVFELIQNVFPKSEESNVIGEMIWNRTQGNALFATEWLRSLQDDDPHSINSSFKLGSGKFYMPSKISKLIEVRVSNLSPDAYTLVQVLAVAGSQAEYQVLAQVVGWPVERLEVGFEELLQRHILQTVEDRGEPVCEFVHPAYNEFFSGKISAIRRYHLLKRLSLAYLGIGKNDDAIEHYIRAGAYADAAELLERHSENCFSAGKITKLQTWLDSLPRDVFQRFPTLLICKAKLLIQAGQLSEAEFYLDLAKMYFAQTGCLTGTAYSSMCTAMIAKARGDSVRSLKMSNRTLLSLPKDDHKSKAEALALKTTTLLEAGHVTQATKAVDEFSSESHLSGDLYLMCLSRTYLARVKAWSCDLHLAFELTKSVISFLRDGYFPASSWAYVIKSFCHYYKGEFEDSLSAALRSIEIDETLGHTICTPMARVFAGNCLLEMTAFDEARNHFQKGIQSGQRVARDAFEVALAISNLARMELMIGNDKDAFSLANSVLVLSNTRMLYPKIIAATIVWQLGDTGEVRNITRQVIGLKSQRDLTQWEDMVANFLLAAVSLQGHGSSGRMYLEKALNTAKKGSIFYTEVGRFIYPALDFAMQHDIIADHAAAMKQMANSGL